MTVQIWLGDHYSHFDKAIAIFDENRVEDVHAIIHQGMLCDTVLLGTSVEMPRCEFLLRWKIRENGLELYDVDPKVTHIFFVNFSKKPINIDNHYTIPPWKTHVVQFNKS